VPLLVSPTVWPPTLTKMHFSPFKKMLVGTRDAPAKQRPV
jgi:hypothetical protein